MQLNPGQRDVYRQRHDAIWPELAAALRDAGISNYRIFLDEETHHLFAVLECRSDHTLDCLPEADVMQRWWSFMADLMATRPDGRPLEQPLVQMFHLA